MEWDVGDDEDGSYSYTIEPLSSLNPLNKKVLPNKADLN